MDGYIEKPIQAVRMFSLLERPWHAIPRRPGGLPHKAASRGKNAGTDAGVAGRRPAGGPLHETEML